MKHLSDEELFELLAEGTEPAHLKECPECRRSFEELAAFAARAATPPSPEPDWEAQRRKVMAAVAPRRRRLGWAGAALAAGLVLAVGLSYFGAQRAVVPGSGLEVAKEAGGEQVALSWWHPDSPLDEDFDGFMDFMIPVAEEENNETHSDTDLRSGDGPVAGAILG